MPVTIRSLFHQMSQLKPEVVDAIRNACENAVLAKAQQLWGNAAVTIRDLNGTDMAYANNVFTETSNATINQWNAMAFGAFAVARATVIGIYGLGIQHLPDGTIDFPPITGVRIDVGGARVAQWHTQILDTYTSAASTAPLYSPFGVTKSPIVIGEDITVTISEYTRTASTVYVPVWLGITCEKEGTTLRP